jgi:hypothetical protein
VINIVIHVVAQVGVVLHREIVVYRHIVIYGEVVVYRYIVIYGEIMIYGEVVIQADVMIQVNMNVSIGISAGVVILFEAEELQSRKSQEGQERQRERDIVPGSGECPQVNESFHVTSPLPSAKLEACEKLCDGARVDANSGI